jgi:hypothetical protein
VFCRPADQGERRLALEADRVCRLFQTYPRGPSLFLHETRWRYGPSLKAEPGPFLGGTCDAVNIVLLFGGVVVLAAAGCERAPERPAPPQAKAQQPHPPQGAPDWRERMQENHNAAQSVEQQVRRLTRDLDLTPEQQEKVRQLSTEHNDRIQKLLDIAPPTLTHEAFTAQVHAISKEFHEAVNAILTPHQLELMKAMVGRLDSGQEDRHAP